MCQDQTAQVTFPSDLPAFGMRPALLLQMIGRQLSGNVRIVTLPAADLSGRAATTSRSFHLHTMRSQRSIACCADLHSSCHDLQSCHFASFFFTMQSSRALFQFDASSPQVTAAAQTVKRLNRSE